MPINGQMTATDWALLTLLSVIWGGSFLFIAIAVSEIPPLTLVVLRTGGGALFMLAVILLTRVSIPTGWAIWGWFLALGLSSNLLPFSLIVYGQTLIPSGLASILNATTPIFTVLVMWAFKGERVGPLKAAGLVVGVAGVAILLSPKLGAGQEARLLGCVAVLVAALLYGLSALATVRLRETPAAVIAFGGLGTATVAGLPVALIVDQPWTLSPSAAAWGATAALAIISSGIAYLLFYRIVFRAGPSNAALVTFLVPISAVLMGTFLLGERLDWTAFAGMAVVFVGLSLIDGRLWRRTRPVTA